MIKRMTEVMNKDFLTHPDIKAIRRPQDRAFALMFFGFKYFLGRSPRPFFGMISNYIDIETNEFAPEKPWAQFRSFLTELPKELPAHGLVIGYTDSLDYDRVRALVRQSPTLRPKSTVAKLVNVVRVTSRRSRGLIGGQVSSIIVPSDPSEDFKVNYHALSPQRTAYFPAHVYAKPPEARSVNSSQFFSTEGSNGPFVAVLPTGRNKLWPCGSGRRYRFCHNPKSAHVIQTHMTCSPTVQADKRSGPWRNCSPRPRPFNAANGAPKHRINLLSHLDRPRRCECTGLKLSVIATSAQPVHHTSALRCWSVLTTLRSLCPRPDGDVDHC
jgi:hypothetical protein